MGRGLSELQKHTLRMAYANHTVEGRLVPRWALKVITAERSDLLRERYTARDVPHIFYSSGDYEVLFDSRETANEEAEWLKENGFNFVHSWESTRCLSDSPNFRGNYYSYEGADLYSYEVLADFFGFSEMPRVQCNGEPCKLRNPEGKRTAGDKHFNVEKIGKARYNAAQAAVSRAFKRLAERGLLFHGYAGVHLTKSGFIEADKLANG